MPEILPNVFHSRRFNSLHGDGVFQYVGMRKMRRNSRSLTVATNEIPEVLSGDGEESLITRTFSSVIKERLALVKERVWVRDKRLCGPV